jgi:transposase
VITLLDEKIEQQLATVPGTAPACTACGLAGGGHAPGCAGEGTTLLILAERLDEITGIGECNARVLIAELGTDPATFPIPGHAAAWARLTSRSRQSGETAKPGRTGKGNRYLRGALGQSAMTAARTDTRLGALYRRIARKRGKQKAIVAVSRVICEIAWILICDPAARYEELGPDYYSPAALPGKPGTRSATSSASTPARRSSSPTRSRPDPALKLARGPGRRPPEEGSQG